MSESCNCIRTFAEAMDKTLGLRFPSAGAVCRPAYDALLADTAKVGSARQIRPGSPYEELVFANMLTVYPDADKHPSPEFMLR